MSPSMKPVSYTHLDVYKRQVLDWNAPAIGFYRSLGARMMDEWTVMRVDGDALPALAQAATSAA